MPQWPGRLLRQIVVVLINLNYSKVAFVDIVHIFCKTAAQFIVRHGEAERNEHVENNVRMGRAVYHAEIMADIPLSELYGYSTTLRSMTGGIGDYSYEFARYEPAPSDVQAKVIEEADKPVETDED